jgi:NADPH:quinone reductase-like Zn-dependent oxidoreductase
MFVDTCFSVLRGHAGPVQFAKWAGATVNATASEKHHEYLKLLGADEVIDHHKVRFEDVVSDVDVVLSSVHGETEERSYGVLKPGGILVSVVGGGENVPEGVRFASLRMQPKEGQLAKIAELIQEGHVRASTEVVLPLESIGEAQDRSETGRTRGKIIIRVER